MALDPGKLRTQLTLQQPNLVPDGMGGHAETWATVAKVHARVEPLAARSTFGADQLREALTHRITVRYRDDLRSGMRFANHDRIFEIMTVHDPDEGGRYLVCNAREEGR